MQRDGYITEKFFENLITKEYPQAKIKRIGRPFDYVINNQYVEVKSARLYIKNKKGEKENYRHGRYRSYSISQMRRMIEKNVWIVLIIQHNEQFIIQGAIKANKLKERERISINKIQELKPLTLKQMMARIK